jgi:hypothetical protein
LSIPYLHYSTYEPKLELWCLFDVNMFAAGCGWSTLHKQNQLLKVDRTVVFGAQGSSLGRPISNPKSGALVR